MAMTAWENTARNEVMKYLGRRGYKTYSQLLGKFHLNITKDPRVVGYMEPKAGRIVINANLDMEQVCVVIRHEILHFYLEHAKRAIRKLAQLNDMNPDTLDDLSIDQLERQIYSNQISNIAADYEISNLGYTEADKEIIRSMHALVTEDDHPDWAELSFEEMYERLLKEANEKPKEKLIYGGILNSKTFVGRDGKMYGKK